jgi:hypothetical protein
MLRALQVRAVRGASRNFDLIAVWMVLLIAQHLLPVTHFLARNDLLPWMVLTLSVVAFLRARPYGYGPHPMLTPRVDAIGLLAQRGASAAVPWALLFLYDAMHDPKPLLVSAGGARWQAPDPQSMTYAAGVILAILIAKAFGSTEGQTAWRPSRESPVVATVGVGVLVVLVVSVFGLMAGRRPDDNIVAAVARAELIGVSFLTIGLMSARMQNHWQRRAAGRKDGAPYAQQLFPAFLATFGPMLTIAIVFLVVRGLAFNFAFVISLLIVVWAAVVWPHPSPMMVSCVLHEVIPIGGSDPVPAAGQANAFDLPPEGALRFNPLATQRTLVMHPWLVPVRSSRIAELDDPIRALWELPPPTLDDHVLGQAAFEPDPLTKQDQWEVMSIRLRGRADMQQMKGGDAQTRRMVILRAFPATGRSARSRLATYRWEEDVPEDTIQILDATTQVAELRDGDLLLLSSEGVARAFEVEIGAPVYRFADANAFRPPQLEDYVEVS